MGRATADLFADEGASVAALDRDGAGVDAVVAGITDAGGQAVAIAVDLADPDRARAAVEEARNALGPIDILVNNAGISLPAPIDDEDFDEAWARRWPST